MRRKPNIHDICDPERVIRHLRLTDVLLVFLPMATVITTIGIRASKVTGMLSEAIIVCALTVGLIICIIYGTIAFVLSLVTRRNLTFRIILLVFLLHASIFYALYLR